MEKEKEKLRRAVPKFGSFKPTTAHEPASDTRSTSDKQVRKVSDDGGKETRRRDGPRDEEDKRRRHDRRRDHEDEREQGRGHRHSDRERERLHARQQERSRERERNRGPTRRTERSERCKREDERSRDRHALRPGSPVALSTRDERDRKDSLLSNDLFTLDKRGDRLILQYGSNDRAEVPAYYRFGAGRIIGSPGFLTIHREGAQELFSIRDPGEGSGSGSAFRDKALVAASRRAQSRLIKATSDQPLPTASDNFISLSSSRKRKRSREHSPAPARQQSTPDYRSIYGKATAATTTNDSSTDSDSDSDSDSPSRSPPPSSSKKFHPTPSDTTTTPQSRATALSSHVKFHPTDIAAWLDLIALQEPLFRHNNNRAHNATTTTTTTATRLPLSSSYWAPLTPDETRALAELRLALYKEALPHATSTEDRERLLLGMMREGGRVWDEKVLSGRWDGVMKQQQQKQQQQQQLMGQRGSGDGKEVGFGFGFDLWRARVDFEMGRVGVFAVEEVRGLVVERLGEVGARLQTVAVQPVNGDGAKTGEGEELCREAVYIFLRLTRLLQDAGYVELAVAAWQALLEMAFYRPLEVAGWDAESALAAFAEFWESEVVRIGEEGAKGWRRFVEAGGAMVAEPPDAKTDRPAEVPQTRDPLQAWAVVEQQAAEKARMPARTLDEGTEDDPFRVVMYSDIKYLLLWFPTIVLPQAQPLLVDAFLVFSGLPVSGVSGEAFANLLDDPYVAAKGPGLNLDQANHDPGMSADFSEKCPDFTQHGGNMAISPEVLFSGHSWFQYLDKWSDIHQAGGNQVDKFWVLSTLKSLVTDAGMEKLAEYYLAMEWLNEPTGARKVAKGLLKQYSSNLGLYNAYALLESANGKTEVSHKVLSSATQLAPLSASKNGQLLWNTWVWIYLEAGQKQEALARLCSSADRSFEGSAVSPALLLKAKSYFSTTRDYSLSSQQLGTATQHAESLMLLEYLTTEADSEPASETQGNVSAALESIHYYSRELQSRNQSHSPHHERLLQSAARLLYHHASHGPYRPTTLRAHLDSFARLFPRNAIFLALLAWFHPSLRILDDPVRHLLRTVTLTPPHDSLAARRLAIRHEARAAAGGGGGAGGGVGGGTVHAVRAAFEAALVDGGRDVCRGSAGLWVDYIRFCRAHEGELRGKAREVFYRAIAACPGAKEVYMEGFKVQGLAGEELRAVVETMVAKGLRVHVDLDEFLRGWK